MTDDAVKYVCQHTVIGRVKIERVLNPASWFTADDYLRAVVTPLTDDDPAEDAAPDEDEEQRAAALEETVKDALRRLVAVQVEAQELPRFSENVGDAANLTRSADSSGFWGMAVAWEALMKQRVIALKNEMRASMVTKVEEFLREDANPDNLPRDMRMEDLPDWLQEDLGRVQSTFRALLDDMDDDLFSMRSQLLVQAESHADRLELLRRMVEREEGRVRTSLSIKKAFE